MRKIGFILCLVLVLIMFTACAAPEIVPTEAPLQTELPTETIPPITEPPTQPPTESPTEPPTEPPVFSADITFAEDYVPGDEVMPYVLYTPSSLDPVEKIPLIVFLHGLGEFGISESGFLAVGLPQVMANWNLEGFRAYVLAPHMTDRWNTGYWYRPEAWSYVQELIERIVDEKSIDREQIILVGFSAGGMGATYFVQEAPELFRKLVIMSSPAPGCKDLSAIKIPTIGYSETYVAGDSFMRAQFPQTFGEDSVRYYDVSHGMVPSAAFYDDADGNGRSDLVEWMLLD